MYNWQFIHSVDFWALVLAKACDADAKFERGSESELKPLIYPLIQIALGAIRFVLFVYALSRLMKNALVQIDPYTSIPSSPSSPHSFTASPLPTQPNVSQPFPPPPSDLDIYDVSVYAPQAEYSPTSRSSIAHPLLCSIP